MIFWQKIPTLRRCATNTSALSWRGVVVGLGWVVGETRGADDEIRTNGEKENGVHRRARRQEHDDVG